MNGSPKILAIVPKREIPSVTIAVEEPLRYLAARGRIRYEIREEARVSYRDIERCDIVFFYRNAEPLALFLLKSAKKSGKRIIYGLDDDFFTIPSTTNVGKYYQRRMIQATLRGLVNAADRVLCHSDFLANYVSRLNQNVVLWKDLHFDFSILRDRGLRREAHKGVRIGYAGTTTHGADFSQVIPAIERIAEEYGNRVSFEFIGYEPRGLKVRAWTHREWLTDYSEFIKLLYSRGWDIGLAPLTDMPFNRGKTNNKCREYAGCKIPAIYSDINVYRTSIRNGKTGIITSNTEQGWYESMKLLIQSPRLRRKICLAAYEFAKSHYQLRRTSDFYLRMFCTLPKRHAEKRDSKLMMIQYSVGKLTGLSYRYLDILYRLLSRDPTYRRVVCGVLSRNNRLSLRQFVISGSVMRKETGMQGR